MMNDQCSLLVELGESGQLLLASSEMSPHRGDSSQSSERLSSGVHSWLGLIRAGYESGLLLLARPFDVLAQVAAPFENG